MTVRSGHFRISRRAFALAAAGLALAGPAGVSLAATSRPAPSKAFTGGAPLPPAPGLGLSRNQDGEPGIAADGGGTIWVGSDIAPYAKNDPRAQPTGVFSGEDIWKSTNGGKTYTWVADPFATGSSSNSGLAGEDSDITAAQVKNTAGYYNVYAVSLWIGSTSLAFSQDGGKTWTVDPLAGIPAEDRPWVAASGACHVYVAYHQLPTFSPMVNTYDLCNLANSGISETLNPVSSTQIFLAGTAPGLSNAFGKIEVDNSPSSPYRGNIYVPMMNCYLTQPTDYVANAESSAGCPGKTQVTIAVSTDGGATFNDYQVAIGDNGEIPVWPDTVATDAAGNVYLAWSDNHNVFLNVSHDGGKTWSATKRVNAAPSLTGVYPTVAAGRAGRVDVSWYGTTRAGDSNDATVMGTPNSAGAAPWAVYVAESVNGGRSFVQAQATGVIHTGELCTQGDACPSNGSRNLLDDFGSTISPTTGLLAIAYTSDQPQGVNATAFTGYTSELRLLVHQPQGSLRAAKGRPARER